MMTKINVTQNHIDKSILIRDDCYKIKINDSCPVAMALTEKLGRPCWVGLRSWGFLDKNQTFELPRNARILVDHFDFKEYNQLGPIEFDVDLRD